jgi:hypothetical protein
MKNIVRLRIWNFGGAVMFSLYGLLIGAWPVFILNGWIALIDLYYLFQMKNRNDYFDILEFISFDGPVIKRFINQYHGDIVKFFPDFDPDCMDRCKGLLILRNLLPVGLFLYHYEGGDHLVIYVDYVIPEYRDLHNAKFLLNEKAPELKEHGVQYLLTYSSHPEHDKYLKKIGFREDHEEITGKKVYKMALPE